MLPTILNGIACDALPDTMSSENLMTKEHASKIGVVIDRSPEKRRVYKNACGISFKSLGEVMVDVTFPDDPSKVWRGCRFSVVERCAISVIIGDPFLRLTQTLTKFRNRLKKLGTSSLKKFWRLAYMDVPRQALSCSLDGHPVLSAADTGSDVDLVSLEYARHRNWNIHEPPSETRDLILADGSIMKVSGYVSVTLGIGNTAFFNTFYILEGFMCDVLLGDSTLEELDVFNEHVDQFVEIDEQEAPSICRNINWQNTIDRRLDDILQGKFPEKTAANLEENRFNRVGFRLVPSIQNVRAWREAFTRALRHLDDREVTARETTLQAMEQLTGATLDGARRRESERQEQHRTKTDKIKEEMDRFLGVVPPTS